MSLRWRVSGELLCGAKSRAKKDDCYIDDRLHYHLSQTGVIDPDFNEKESGLWHWRKPRRPHWKIK